MIKKESVQTTKVFDQNFKTILKCFLSISLLKQVLCHHCYIQNVWGQM